MHLSGLFAKSPVQMFCKGTQALSQKLKQTAGNIYRKSKILPETGKNFAERFVCHVE